MEVYIEKPTDEQYQLLSGLFEDWCKSGRSNLLHHMFEIIESHESMEIRDLVLEHMKKNYPDSKKDDIVELWITHPLPRMKQFIAEIIESPKFEKPIKAAAYVMLDEYDSLSKIDPDFHHLDIYLRDVDPLLGSLLIQKVEQLKNPELNSDISQIITSDSDDMTLMDRIRKRDFTFIWENILDYPFPFVVEVLHIFHEEEWSPVDESGKELYEILIEQVGTDGWYSVDSCKWVVLSKKVDGRFVPVNRVDIDRGSFDLKLSQNLIVRPDRITSEKFQSRGRFNLSNPQLGLNIYMQGVRKSDFDGLLHVPIYSNNGVELVEFTIPASSEKSFAMDEDGLYFTVRNKEGTFSVDLDALAAFLLPISRHSEMVNEMIPILLERADEEQQMPIKAMNLLSTLHRGREFSLWDKKKTKAWDDTRLDDLDTKSCLCTIAIDIGNDTTKVSQVVKGGCDHEPRTWKFPTIIYYRSPTDILFGEAVLDEDLIGTSQTFQNIKASLKYGGQRHLRIQNSIISSFDAYRDYLNAIIDEVQTDLDFDINSIAMTFPLHAPSGFEGWLRGILLDRGIERVELTDELSASLMGSYRLHNQRGNVMLIDIGSSQMSACIANMDGNKTRKRLEEARMREDLDRTAEIVAKLSVDRGSLDISEMMFDQSKLESLEFHELAHLIDQTKARLSKDYSASIDLEGTSYSFGMSDEDPINMDRVFSSSELYHAFKILLRNVMVKSNHRGLKKDDLETILILGQGSQWPGFLDYINKIFDGKEIIIEDDEYLTSKGAGLIANGQQLSMKVERDILLKVAKNGIVGYEPVLVRGENPIGKSKEFEIRPHARVDKLVVDCWVRRPNFVADEEVQPMRDNQNTGHTKDSTELFSYDRVFRQIVDLDGDSDLRVNVSTRGTLYFEILGDETILLSTETSVY